MKDKTQYLQCTFSLEFDSTYSTEKYRLECRTFYLALITFCESIDTKVEPVLCSLQAIIKPTRVVCGALYRKNGNFGARA